MSSDDEHTFDGTIRTTIDLRIYRLSAVKKAAYRLAERLTASIASDDESSVAVTFTFKPGTTEPVAREAVRLFAQELLDQDLRESVAEETEQLRTLILAQAFSKTDLIGGDQ